MDTSLMMNQDNKSKYVYCVGVDVVETTFGLHIKHTTEIPVYSDHLTDQAGGAGWVNAVEFALSLTQSQHPKAKVDLAYCKSWK